jgi:hypothetical protein
MEILVLLHYVCNISMSMPYASLPSSTHDSEKSTSFKEVNCVPVACKKVEENEVDGTCGMNGGEEERV